MGTAEWHWSQFTGIGPPLELIWCTQNYFTLLRLPQCPSKLVTVFLGTLCSSIKQVKAPYVFDGEHGIALHTLQGNQASSRGEGEVSWFFMNCGGNLGYILRLRRGWPFKTHVCSATSGLLSSYEGHRRKLVKDWQGNRDASRGEVGNPRSLSSCHREIGIPISFQEESGIITF